MPTCLRHRSPTERLRIRLCLHPLRTTGQELRPQPAERSTQTVLLGSASEQSSRVPNAPTSDAHLRPTDRGVRRAACDATGSVQSSPSNPLQRPACCATSRGGRQAGMAARLAGTGRAVYGDVAGYAAVSGRLQEPDAGSGWKARLREQAWGGGSRASASREWAFCASDSSTSEYGSCARQRRHSTATVRRCPSDASRTRHRPAPAAEPPDQILRPRSAGLRRSSVASMTGGLKRSDGRERRDDTLVGNDTA